MPNRTYRWLVWTLAVLGLAGDQSSKYGVFGWLAQEDGKSYALFQTEPESRRLTMVPADERGAMRGFFLEVAFDMTPEGELVPHVNQGALFGVLREQKGLANLLFAVVSLLAALGIAVWSWQTSTARDFWLCLVLGLILGGTLGNFFDRVKFDGVRDFLHWNYGFDWPVFNIADCCLVVGAFLLMIQAFLAPQPAKEPAVEAKTAESVATPG